MESVDLFGVLLGGYCIFQSIALIIALWSLRRINRELIQVERDMEADKQLMHTLSQQSQAIRAASRRLLTNLKGYTENKYVQITGASLHDLLAPEMFQLDQALKGKADGIT